MDIFVNSTKDSVVAAVPASLFNSNADLQMGAFTAGTSLLTGSVSLMFLCAAALTDTIIKSLYNHSRALFGIKD